MQICQSLCLAMPPALQVPYETLVARGLPEVERALLQEFAAALSLPEARLLVLTIRPGRLHNMDLTIGDPLLSLVAEDEQRMSPTGTTATPRTSVDIPSSHSGDVAASDDGRAYLRAPEAGTLRRSSIATVPSSSSLNLLAASSSSPAASVPSPSPNGSRRLPDRALSVVAVAIVPAPLGNVADGLAAAEEFVVAFARLESARFAAASSLPGDTNTRPTILIGKRACGAGRAGAAACAVAAHRAVYVRPCSGTAGRAQHRRSGSTPIWRSATCSCMPATRRRRRHAAHRRRCRGCRACTRGCSGWTSFARTASCRRSCAPPTRRYTLNARACREPTPAGRFAAG